MTVAVKTAFESLNDSEYVFPTLDDYKAEHAGDLAFLQALVGSHVDVVVTHHMPHPGLAHPKFHGNPANSGFVSDLTPLIAQLRPALWVCGHSHDAGEVQEGPTRLLMRPWGYPRNRETGETGLEFDYGRFSIQREE